MTTKIKLLGLLIALMLTGGTGYALMADNGKPSRDIPIMKSLDVRNLPSDDLICQSFEEAFAEGYRKRPSYAPPYQAKENFYLDYDSCRVELNRKIKNSEVPTVEVEIDIRVLHKETGKGAGNLPFIMEFIQDENEQWYMVR